MKNKILPPLVLTIICGTISALLVFAYQLTYKDETGILTEKLKSCCFEIFGEQEYKMLVNEDKENKKTVPENFGYDKLDSVIIPQNGGVIFEITEDGYAKNGLHILVGLNEKGIIEGISFISILETPNLGTKVKNSGFLEQFTGGKDIDAADNITGATYSSKGMKSALKLALEIFDKNREAILNEQP